MADGTAEECELVYVDLHSSNQPITISYISPSRLLLVQINQLEAVIQMVGNQAPSSTLDILCRNCGSKYINV